MDTIITGIMITAITLVHTMNIIATTTIIPEDTTTISGRHISTSWRTP